MIRDVDGDGLARMGDVSVHGLSQRHRRSSIEGGNERCLRKVGARSVNGAPMSIQANKALLERYFEALNRHDVTALGEFYHSDYVQVEPPEEMVPGLEGLRQWVSTWIEAFPDMRWIVEEQIGEEDQVWSRSTWQGTHQGPYLGLSATGKKVTSAVWTINRFQDGKIVESRWMRDRLGLMRQLGVIPQPAFSPR